MEKLIETMVRPLIAHPEQFSVQQIDRERSITYEVRLHPNDVGKVIGKKGRIIQAMRTIVAASSRINPQPGRKVYLDVREAD